ncbi:MAG: heme o synthase [Thaumarchaeota archaeon]|nr:protoheme IX farnesyltransferase [Nitrososphaerota archaeon]MBI3023991.1 protoheme IX farnesyltransferase [Nitrososphaerota archaeon]MBI3116113.1 protoheme IX farnesyltransferase [Nitrososphaerota archaeon]MCS4540189.1 heme o synthase [Nitrososphaerota archaeon]
MNLTAYLQLTKPKIIPLLILVALASSVIATRGLPSLTIAVGLLVGGTLTSAGSLAINSYLEVDIDSKMRRTMTRPLPSNRIVPPRKALFFGLVLIALGVGISFLLLPALATLFIALGSIVYIPIYTIWLKPRTSWNIVLGGFAGSCASLAGWYAITTSNAYVAWILAALVFVWTPTHFWSLAVVTEQDYSAAGIPMLPSVVGEVRASRFIVANTLLLIPVSLLFYLYLTGVGTLIYLVGALIFDAILLATNVKLLLSPTRANAWLAFKFSSPYLAVIFILASASVLM